MEREERWKERKKERKSGGGVHDGSQGGRDEIVGQCRRWWGWNGGRVPGGGGMKGWG